MRPAADTAPLERAIESRIPMQRAPHTAQHSLRNMRHPVPVRDRASRYVRTHRLGVGDRAALERDRPVDHRDHTTTILRTAEPHPPPPPSLTAPAPPTRIGPDTHRCPPARTHASVPDIATPSNSAAPLSMVITPPLPYCARVQRAARSAKALASRPHRARHATRNIPRAPCDMRLQPTHPM